MSRTAEGMAAGPEARRAALASALRAADAGAFLVPGRIVRRVIRELTELPGLGLAIPHRKTFVVRREALFRIVGREELGLAEGAWPPDPVLLVAEPSDEALEHLPPRELLRRVWRLLFHAKIHAVLDLGAAAGRFPVETIRARIDEIGQTSFDEIRAVLRQEELVLPPRTDRAVYFEFAAFFLDTLHFAPNLLGHYFPSLTDPERVRRVLGRDVEEARLLAGTRPAGAPEPGEVDLAHEEHLRFAADRAAREEPEGRPSARRHRRLRRVARRAAKRGNSVRAAIWFRRAARRAPSGGGEEERAEAAREIERLLARLAKALSLPPEELPDWSEGLSALLRRTGARMWTREARTLYDLQKVCTDHERGVFTIDPVEWALSLGKRPVRRWLPSEREVLMNRHLRSAARRLPLLRLPPEVHDRLAPLLHHAMAAAETRLRDTFRPRIPAVFRDVGLEPASLPERMALAKLTEELLDQIVARGRLRMGDLRDAISRNQLKLPDVRNPLSVFSRDPLLRADRKLAVSLDGVYRRAEFYVRWLQRISALVLGTAIGRHFVKFAAIPFGGAFVVLEGVQALGHEITRVVGGHMVRLMSPLRMLLVGAFFLGLIHSPGFRRKVWGGLRHFFRAWRIVFWTVPAWLLGLPVVKRLLESRPFRLVLRFLLKPAFYTAAIYGILRLFGSRSPGSFREVALAFVALDFLVNIPAGRRLEEITYDRLSRNLHRFRVRVLAGLYQLVVGFFRDVTDAIDRFLYSVDEWLRFRSGESRLSLVVKPVAGVIWFFVSYVIRLYTNLLIEPQVNPIKHFPVVTVSHKLTLPVAYDLTRYLATPLNPLGPVMANTIAGTTVLLMPGIFGFLVWELKENWKLFAGNRPKALRPVRIGHHGETMLRLMKPGFHSGTLPKLFSRLRRAERKAWKPGIDRRIRKLSNDLHHVGEAIGHFAERDLLPLLGAACSVGHVGIASNTVRIPIHRSGSAAGPMILAFEEQSGCLVASVREAGFLADLGAPELRRVRNALAGFYTRAGVEIVREQVRATLGEGPVAYDISDAGLVVWPGGGWETEIVRPLRGKAASDLLFSETPLLWRDWVAAWEAEGEPPRLLASVRLLPPVMLEGPSPTGDRS